GDFALLGCYLKAQVTAERPGHAVNAAFVKQLAKRAKKDMAVEALPHWDPNAKPLYDINQIQQILPHRPPFLLVDKIVYMDKDQVVGIKNVTMNEAFSWATSRARPSCRGFCRWKPWRNAAASIC
ncbi:MAG: UDP-3-O-acyl-N-acetylglucosamine deacetylase, partial [Bacteroidales bacterium]|nr:UDP-3-O-acyl-N-acetylglucosamine deacetylase [Bacteroidales bacterium]